MRSWRDWSWADGNFWDSGVQPQDVVFAAGGVKAAIQGRSRAWRGRRRRRGWTGCRWRAERAWTPPEAFQTLSRRGQGEALPPCPLPPGEGLSCCWPSTALPAPSCCCRRGRWPRPGRPSAAARGGRRGGPLRGGQVCAEEKLSVMNNSHRKIFNFQRLIDFSTEKSENNSHDPGEQLSEPVRTTPTRTAFPQP